MTGHRIELVPSERRVRVTVAGELIAESERVLELHETGHRIRWYLPVEDVREGVLEPSEKTSHCPFKGDATTSPYAPATSCTPTSSGPTGIRSPRSARSRTWSASTKSGST